MTPDLQKSSKNLEMLKKFFCSKQPKKSYFTFGTTFWVDLVNFRLNNENEELVVFEKFHEPGPAKKFKKFGNIQKKFFLETTKKILIHVRNNILGSFGEF